MPIRLTSSQARRLKLNTEGAVSAPEPQRTRKEPLGDLREAPKGVQERRGVIGGRQHTFKWDAPRGSWLSKCGLIGTSRTPDGRRGRACGGCGEKEVQGE